MTMRALLAAGVAAISVLTAACGDDTPTTPTTTTPTITTELFTGTLPLRGSAFYSYVVSTQGTASVTLASLTLANARVASSTELTLGIGFPAGEDCALTQFVSASPALIAQLAPNQSPGTYCVRVSDPGTLTQTATFAIRIVHP